VSASAIAQIDIGRSRRSARGHLVSRDAAPYPEGATPTGELKPQWSVATVCRLSSRNPSQRTFCWLASRSGGQLMKRSPSGSSRRSRDRCRLDRTSLAVHDLPVRARLADGLQRLLAGQMDQINRRFRTTRHSDGPLHRQPLGRARPRVGEIAHTEFALGGEPRADEAQQAVILAMDVAQRSQFPARAIALRYWPACSSKRANPNMNILKLG
jgi:hypothetical protein